MHLQDTAVAHSVDRLAASVPLAGKLRPATTACAGLSYARVSKSIQTTIPAQQERILRLAHREGVPVLGELSDTRSGMRADRIGYQRLLEEARTGRYSHVFLFKADRLARDSEELIGTVKMLWRLGITVMDTSVGLIDQHNLHLLALLAEMEIRNLSERTDMGLRSHVAQGSKLGHGLLGYIAARDANGERVKGRWVPDEAHTAPLVRELFRRAAAGTSISALTRWLNDELGTHKVPNDVRRLLRQPYYVGLNVNFRTRQSILDSSYAQPREQWAISRHQHALIDETTWQAVQARLDATTGLRASRRDGRVYPLQGLLCCGRCGKQMCGHTKRDNSQQYRCPSCRTEKGARRVERAVRRCLEAIPLNAADAASALHEELAEQRENLVREQRELTAAIERLTQRRVRVYSLLEDGTIDREQYDAQVTSIDTDRAHLRRQEEDLREQLDRLPLTDALVRQVANDTRGWLFWPDKLAALSIEDQQAAYRECCQNVLLDAASGSLAVTYTQHIGLLVGRPSNSTDL